MVNYVPQTFEILDFYDDVAPMKRIERIGRISYKSEDRITEDSYGKFLDIILDKKHFAVIEFVSVAVKFTTDRGISHEIVRHRIPSYLQESTRFCNYAKADQITVIDHRNDIWNQYDPCSVPRWDHDEDEEFFMQELDPSSKDPEIRARIAYTAVKTWEGAMEDAERRYMAMMKLGKKAQIARGVLPTDLKTEIVVYTNLREWGHIFALRTAPDAHPYMQSLMKPVLEEFRKMFPKIYDEENLPKFV